MSAKQEPALLPATVSQADIGGPNNLQPHSSQHQQLPSNYHQGPIIYQQQAYTPVTHYQHQGPQVWNQPPHNTVHFVQYAPQEAATFQDNKVQSYTHYGTVHYAQPIDNGDMIMRTHQSAAYIPQQYVTSPQWYQSGQQPPTQYIPAYATTFNVANDPIYHPSHPMNRPSAVRRDDFHGDSPSVGYMQFVPFVAPIGIVESQAHASASYTANWVSSTSSIPPEMKDEPESDNISQYDSQRPTSQINGDNWTDTEDHLSPTTTQAFHLSSQPRPQQYTEKDKTNSQGPSKTSKISKGDRVDAKRELTFDERLHKAKMQKNRVENEGANGAPSPSSAPTVTAGSVIANSSTSVQTPRSNGQRKDHTGNARNESFNNNSHIANKGGRDGDIHHNYNGNEGQSGAGPGTNQQRQPQQYQHNQNGPPRYERGNAAENATGERVKQSKRDNNYSNNRFDNNSQPSQQYNQRNQQYQQYQNQAREGGSEFHRQSSYRGARGGRGGYRGAYQPQGHGHPSAPNAHQPQHAGNSFAIPHNQVMSPQMVATMNAFQNANIGNMPPGVHRMPLLPGPFGMPRHPALPQDIKFQNTWLDAASCPMPLSAVMSIDTRFGRGSYRGGGRGRANWVYRGYRGQNNSGPSRYTGKAPDAPPLATTPKETDQETTTEVNQQVSKSEDETVTEVVMSSETAKQQTATEDPTESVKQISEETSKKTESQK